MQQAWEHKWEICGVNGETELLRKASDEGWELVTAVAINAEGGETTHIKLFFKRPEQD